MPKLADMYPSRWLRATDCEDGDLILTIEDVRQEKVGMGGDDSLKWVVYFHENDKGLVLNKTNSNTIAKLYGDDTDDWTGKKVVLYATEVQFQGDMVDAIRVRTKPPKAAAKPVRGLATPTVAEAAAADDPDIPF